MRLRSVALMRRLVLNVGLFLLASLVAAGLGEMLVRLVVPQQLIAIRPDVYRAVDSLGWAHQPYLNTLINTGERTVSLFTDSSGFRVGSKGRPEGRRRILLLGDSFMAAVQVEYEQSLPGLIERCFESRTGESAAVWNTGVPAWDPPQYYLQAQQALSSSRFDLVLVSVFLGNDIVDERRRLIIPPRQPDPRRSLRWPRNMEFDELVSSLLAPINDGLETRSHLFVFFKNRFQTLLMRLRLTAVEVPSEIRRSQATSSRWRFTGDILARIDSLAAKHGTPAAFFLIPSIEQVEPEILELRSKAFGISPDSLDLDQPGQLLSAELERHRLSFVSLLGPLREAQVRGVTLYGKVDMHPSAEGHRVMWDAVAPFLAERLGLTFRPDSVEGPC